MTQAVTAGGQPVAYWPDKSGHGYHATQSNPLQAPPFAAASQNGMGTLGFVPGSNFAHDQTLTTSYNGPLGTVTVFVVYKMDTWNQLAWARLLDEGSDSSFF